VTKFFHQLSEALQPLESDDVFESDVRDALERARESGKRDPRFEPAIMKNPEWACHYATDVIRDRWPEAESTIMKDSGWAWLYAKYVIGDRWPEAEPYIRKNPGFAFWYAKDIIKGRWPEAEPHYERS